MRLLDRKVLRDVAHLKGQLFAVTILVACGVAVFIMLRSMNGYLRGSQDAYYAEYGFGEVFASAKSVPRPVETRIAAVDGVDRVYTRIVRDVLLDVPDLPEPATGRLVSLPDHGPPPLNRLHLRSGSMPEPGRRDQVVVSDAFATANGFQVGATFGAVLNGRWERLTIVGTAISPEFIYEVNAYGGGMFPDNRRFGAMWMSAGAMAAAFEMEGAFNDLVATLVPGASEAAVLSDIDEVLEPYGGLGAYGRDEHISHVFVSSEIDETAVTASFFPALFLVVTAFLLHTTLLRLVRMEREQIGLLKAFGFPAGTVARHYVKLALVPVTGGAVFGAVVGGWLAGSLAGIYARFYQFPESDFQLDPVVLMAGLGIAVATGVAGAIAAARSVVRLAPAVAMAPPAPPRFRSGWLEAGQLWEVLTMTGRMIVRNLARSRWKSLTTGAGVAMSLGVLVALLTMFDAITVIRNVQFEHVMREDLSVFFDGPRSDAAIREMLHLPGVLEAEPMRMAPALITHEHRERRVGLMGLEPGTQLRRMVDAQLKDHPPPADGLLVGRLLAERLDVRPGSLVHVEITQGRRPTADLRIAGVVDQLIGSEVSMEAETLDALLEEPLGVSGAWLRVDPLVRDELYETLKRLPGVATVQVKDVMVQGFDDTIQESFTIALDSTLLLGVALVMAIVYNQARVALSERGRELASLRVLGFSRREVARMLLGEQIVIVFAALPFGLLLGWSLTWLAMKRFEADLFRLPVVAIPGTYLLAVAIVLASTAMAAVLVRRRLDRIDLIEVLKTRE